MAVEWVTENVRVSLFMNAPVQITEDHWRAITGQAEAQSRQIVVGGRVFSGPFAGGQLSLAGSANRIDVIFIPDAEPNDSDLPVVAPWCPTRDKFVDFTTAWIKRDDSYPPDSFRCDSSMRHPKRDSIILAAENVTFVGYN
jgi:hypothetical protein